MFGPDGYIGNEDTEYCFYYPERMKAGILWTSSGYVEYKFSNGVPRKRKIKRASISMEICSEAPGYKEDWKSDLTLWVMMWRWEPGPAREISGAEEDD